MRRAFTLVEVTVIVTVIAIIAALTIPNVVAMARGRERDEPAEGGSSQYTPAVSSEMEVSADRSKG